MRQLNPPRNFRKVGHVRRCCHCRHLSFDDGGWAVCDRPDGPIFDTGDREYEYTACNNWEVEDGNYQRREREDV